MRRPLNGPEQDYALALCNAQSMKVNKVMSVDEMILFQLFDNSNTKAKFCVHSAFLDPTVGTEAPSRASIEVRAIFIG
ncbi:hypothetical protein DID88_003604 [Monilinia fructigena]|uniref:Uncharacterized protein n=1 Tax=Monilinia fructigena TaxID=38457 RepID=A0A395ITC5_9HELO|nr:hypothetical protein DID88_003604 [Monilinia fructigena]